MHACRSRTEVVGDRKRTAPIGRSNWTRERAKQGERIGVGDWEHRDLRDRQRVLAIETLCARRRGNTRCQRIAGIDRHVGDRSALRSVLVAIGALRIHVALEIPIVARIGVDETADRPMLGGNLRLDAAPRSAVACDHDLAANLDAVLRQLVVILRNSVVDVHQLAGHVAVGRVGVEDRKLLIRLTGCPVLRQARLEQLRRVLLRRSHFDDAHSRSGKEDIERFDLRVVSPRSKQRGDELGVFFSVGRAEVVRTRGEALHPVAEILAIELRIEGRLERALLRGAGTAEAGDRFVGFGSKDAGGQDEDEHHQSHGREIVSAANPR